MSGLICSAALLRPGDLLVFNDTKVIPARLVGRRGGRRGATLVDVTLHRDLGGGWRTFVKGAHRLDVGDRLVFAGDFSADVAEKHPEGDVTLRFDLEAEAFRDALARCRRRSMSNARAAAIRATEQPIRRSLPAPRVPWRRRPQVLRRKSADATRDRNMISQSENDLLNRVGRSMAIGALISQY
jgi:Queuosine biosynthesis protein